MTRIDDWYRALEQSALIPPDWALAPGWTGMYALAVVAGVTGWRAVRKSAKRAWLISLFFSTPFLNISWSGVFFYLPRANRALAQVAMLWLSAAMLISLMVRFSRAAALYLTPYLLWVGFAVWLNYSVGALNGPFG
jgi:benzodiazapine receptor